jgi:hypothetical protein
VAVLSHALLLIASLFAAPLGAADAVAVCQSVPSVSQFAADDVEHESARTPHEHSVRVYAAFRTRDRTPLRVLGRCVVKPAPEHQQPVLFGSFTVQVDDYDDHNLASARAHTRAPFPRHAGIGVAPAEMYVLRAPRTQLERPPRV